MLINVWIVQHYQSFPLTTRHMPKIFSACMDILYNNMIKDQRWLGAVWKLNEAVFRLIRTQQGSLAILHIPLRHYLILPFPNIKTLTSFKLRLDDDLPVTSFIFTLVFIPTFIYHKHHIYSTLVLVVFCFIFLWISTCIPPSFLSIVFLLQLFN